MLPIGHYLYSIDSPQNEISRRKNVNASRCITAFAENVGLEEVYELFALDFWTENTFFPIYVFLKANIYMKVIRTNVAGL